MNMKSILSIASLMIAGLGFAGEVSAGQSAALRCENHTCDKQELIVTITTDDKREEGTFGGYGIIAIPLVPNATMPDSSEVAYWTETDGWSTYGNNELLKPTADPKKLKPTQEFSVLHKTDFCKFSATRGFNLYAWHAGLNVAELNKLKSFFKEFEIDGEQRENFINALLIYKAHKENKVGKVFSFECKIDDGINQYLQR
jgi:hypothetical protein